MSAGQDFNAAARSLTEAEQVLFALLALCEPVHITGWAEAGSLAGVRDSPTRKLSSQVLRPVAAKLISLGLAREEGGRFACAAGRRTLALRWAAARADFHELARSSWGINPDPACDARAAIFGKGSQALELLDDLIKEEREFAESLALEVNEPFDALWFADLPAALRQRLLELAMVGSERRPRELSSMYQALAGDLELLRGGTATAVGAFAGVAALRGDLPVLRALEASGVAGGHAPLVRVALAVMEGRYQEAANEADALPDPKKGDHAGVLLVLAVVALRVNAPRSERVLKWIAFGGKNGAPLQQSFRVLEALVRSEGHGLVQLSWAKNVGPDSLTALLHALLPHDAVLDSYRVVGLVDDLAKVIDGYRRAGYVWLSEQYASAQWTLFETLPERARAMLVSPPPKEPKLTVGPPLSSAKTTKEKWELDLELLMSLAGRLKPQNRELESHAQERLFWRTSGAHGSLEPYVQKRTATGKWTSGRKLAIKHLLDSRGVTASLPPEDQRVAAFAREHRSVSYGYPVITHHIDMDAWGALVGHPRVFYGHEESPRQVVRGEPRLIVRSEGDGLVVELSPAELSAGVSVHATEDQLVVYQLPDQLAPLLTTLRKKLKVPAHAKDRVHALLEQLAGAFAIESTEQTGASAVPADETLVVRLVPSQGGLSVSMLVRPLGPSTAAVSPGRGAPTLLGMVEGKAVQTQRDLAREEALAAAAAARCGVLAGCETGAHTWHVNEPEACLALVSALHSMGDAVLVEWPHGKPLRVRARLGRRAMRGKLKNDKGLFSLDASIAIDAELSLELSQMLELLAEHPGRFVQLASGEYVELEQDLRDVLDGIAAARRPDASARVTFAPSATAVLEQLTSEGTALTLDARSKEWRDRFAEAFASTPKLPRGFAGDLRDYQRGGFRWLARLADLELGACLADDMGLGKTVQLIALLLHRAAGGPALIVAPTSVCENWRRELSRFAPSLSVRVFAGSDREGALDGLGRRDVVIVSYTLLQQDAAKLQAVVWNTAILDEAQLIKNPDTLRAKAAFELQAKARVVATGTPVENHVGDLFSLFHFLNPGLLGSFKSFSAKASSGSRALKRLITPFVLRRTKAQVLEDLPPVTEIQRTVLLTPGEAKLYESVRKSALAKLREVGTGGQGRVQVFAELTRLRRLCCHPQLVAPQSGLTSSKLESFLELAEELVAAHHRILVFSQFTDVLALVRPLLDAKGISYQYLDGSTPPKQRTAAVDAFQDGQGDVFLISLKAGGFGLNLTAADYVVHLDPWWNPAVESQASDRAHRIGQTRPVTVYRLVTAGTIESRIVELHRDKRELADAVLAETDRAAKLSAAELRGLLES